MSIKRVLRIAAVLVVIIIVAVWAFSPSPVPADFAEVTRGSLEVTVSDEGRTRVRDRYVVSAPLPGRMRRIELDPGDRVIAGRTVLAQFEPSAPTLLDVRTRAELEARVKAAQAALGAARAERERVRAEVEFAEAELKRARRLVEEKVIAPRELEAVERQAAVAARSLQSAEFSVTTAEHELEMARASLIQSRGGGTKPIPLLSPIDGVVLRVVQESETVVPTGQPLLEVGDVEDLEIVSDLLSSAAVHVKPGQHVLIEQWGGDQPLKGRVRRVEPSGFTKISALGVEEQRVNVIIDFADPPESRPNIGDGYRVEVRIIVSARENVLKVPTSSLFRHEGDWAVYVVENGRAVRRTVQLGERNSLEAEVVSGLSEGERLIVYPSDAVSDGVEVTAR